jgi:hypothetical protein
MIPDFFKPLFPFSLNLKLSSALKRIQKNIAGYFVAFQNVLVETSALINPGVHFPVRVAEAQVAVSRFGALLHSRAKLTWLRFFTAAQIPSLDSVFYSPF